MIAAGIASMVRSNPENKEKAIEKAQAELDKKMIGGDARQIINYLLNPKHRETESGQKRSLTEIAERLKGAAKTARKPAKTAKTSKKAAKARKPHAKEQ